MACSRRVAPRATQRYTRPSDAAEINRVAGLFGQLFENEKLRAAVALAERMDVVHVAKDSGRGFGEPSFVQTVQEIVFSKPPMDIRHSGFDMPAKLELASPLGDLDRANFPGPIIDILEEMPVNGAKMGEVETADGNAFGRACDRQPTLNNVQLVGAGDAGPISENGRPWIDIRGVIAHSAASCLT